jgi:pimeloyl-ACP methyl ester carboxylesterase
MVAPMPEPPLPPAVETWRRRGERVRHGAWWIHVVAVDGPAPPVLLLHGFPTSSYDWAPVLEHGIGRAAVAPDFLGFGLSDKPVQDNRLMEQADVVETVVAARGIGRAALVAHDMGTSVATELLARDLEQRLPFALERVLLFNGSMLQERATLTLGQRLLRTPLAPVAVRAPGMGAFFRRQLASVFSPGHPLPASEAQAHWALWARARGDRMAHRLARYVDDRYRHRDRWLGAIRDWPGDLRFAWGLRDPVANPSILAGLRELRPGALVTELPELGHYPHLEDPARMAAVIREAIG